MNLDRSGKGESAGKMKDRKGKREARREEQRTKDSFGIGLSKAWRKISTGSTMTKERYRRKGPLMRKHVRGQGGIGRKHPCGFSISKKQPCGLSITNSSNGLNGDNVQIRCDMRPKNSTNRDRGDSYTLRGFV